MATKTPTEKKPKAGIEPHWQRLVKVYFDIYKENFKDEQGYALEPNWKGVVVGMESKALKEIIIRLRTIAEQKNFDWTEMYAIEQLTIFFKKALTTWMKKSFLCCQMNKFKNEVIVMAYNNPLVQKIVETFYQINPNYFHDDDKDFAAGEIIIGFLRANFLRANIEFSEVAVLQSVRTIFNFVRQDDFWNKKSMKAISNNLQEFVNKIKANAQSNGTNGKRPVPIIRSKNDFGEL